MFFDVILIVQLSPAFRKVHRAYVREFRLLTSAPNKLVSLIHEQQNFRDIGVHGAYLLRIKLLADGLIMSLHRGYGGPPHSSEF